MPIQFKKSILSRTRRQKRLILVTLDILLIPIVLFGSFSLRYTETYIFSGKVWLIFPLAVVVAIPIFIKLGLYRAILRYFRSQAITSMLVATLLSTITWVGVVNLLDVADIPTSIALLYWLGTLTVIVGTRLTAQKWLYGSTIGNNSGKRILIYGAGVAGSQLASVLKTDPCYSVAGFIDDDLTLKGWSVLGHTIYSPFQLEEIIQKQSIVEIVLAMPSAGAAKRQNILKKLEQLDVTVRSIPAFADLASGKLKASDIKDIDIDDLLGRDEVKPNGALLPANIKDKVVMITGAGGSIGSELCRQIINLNPKKIILLEQNEFALYTIEQELEAIIKKNGIIVTLNKVLGSITNPVLLKRLFQHKNIQTIYHAAAYKHVPLVEENPVAGLSNNIYGTLLLAEQALSANVETFILISTDKAVRPTNVMGCSKRVAEMILQALSEKYDNKTIFSMVRFGNVLGSSGSVVPKFRQQIKEGGPITVTHKEITRFFMSIPEAVQLVIQAGAMAKGGDVFVLDMGDSVKISDLAEKMVKLSGLSIKNDTNLEGDIKITYTGLRPGEKLYEELLIGDNVSGTKHPRIMRANETYKAWPVLQQQLDNLQDAIETAKVDVIKSELAKLVDGYIPWIHSKETIEQSKQDNIVKIR